MVTGPVTRISQSPSAQARRLVPSAAVGNGALLVVGAALLDAAVALVLAGAGDDGGVVVDAVGEPPHAETAPATVSVVRTVLAIRYRIRER